MVAMYHAQQARAWTSNIIDGFESMLANAGIHSRLERPPAICFLDISGQGRKWDEADEGPGYSSEKGGIGILPSGGLGGWAPGVQSRPLPEGVGRALWAAPE